MAWGQVASLKGPEGEQGIQGTKGDQGIQGIQGIPGVDGKGISIAGSVATYANLPTGLGAGDAGKGYLVEADGKLYIWSGTAFPANGSGTAFKGDKGDRGDQGIQGVAGNQGIQGIQGFKGDTGNTGANGARGSKIYSGNGAPGTVSGSAAGDFYLDRTSGLLYELS